MIEAIGYFIVFACLALVLYMRAIAAKKSSKHDKYYKCKANPLPDCRPYCCSRCMGAPKCDWACDGNPDECGMVFDTEQEWD